MVAIPQSGLLAQVSSLRLPLGHSGPILTLSNATGASLPSPCMLAAGAGICAASLLLGMYSVGLIIYLCFLPIILPSQIPRLATDPPERVFHGVWKPLFFFLRLPSPDRSQPLPLLSLFIFYILSYLLLKTMGCFSGRLISSASIQKLFCGICLGLKCSFDEFVGEKVVSPSYSSSILGPPPHLSICF